MRPRMLSILALLLPIGGCMPGQIGASGGSPRACLAENARFLDAWACVRMRLEARQKDGTPRDGLLEEGEILAAQVRAGEVPEAEARKRLAGGLAHEPS